MRQRRWPIILALLAAGCAVDQKKEVARYRRVGQGNPQAKRIAVYTYAYPVDLDQRPRGDRS